MPAIPKTIKAEHIDNAFARFMPTTPMKPTVVDAAASTGAKRVTARLENVTDGICPYCKSRMQLTSAGGFRVFVCGHDRAVSPVPDSMNDASAVMSSL